jgi:prophage antirepressor-like protein
MTGYKPTTFNHAQFGKVSMIKKDDVLLFKMADIARILAIPTHSLVRRCSYYLRMNTVLRASIALLILINRYFLLQNPFYYYYLK